MSVKTYKARIMLKGRHDTMEVRIQADNSSNAKRLLEAQYGKGTVRGNVDEVR